MTICKSVVNVCLQDNHYLPRTKSFQIGTYFKLLIYTEHDALMNKDVLKKHKKQYIIKPSRYFVINPIPP